MDKFNQLVTLKDNGIDGSKMTEVTREILSYLKPDMFKHHDAEAALSPTQGVFRTGMDYKKKYLFVVKMMELGVPELAAAQCMISIKQVKKEMSDHDDFRDAVVWAKDWHGAVIMTEIQRRSVEGYDEPVWFQGEEVGTVRKHSDRLLELLAKAKLPDIFQNDQAAINVNVNSGVLVAPQVVKSIDDWEAEASPIKPQ